MVESGALKFMLLIFLFFYFFAGLFNIENSDEFNINDYTPIKNALTNIQSYKTSLFEINQDEESSPLAKLYSVVGYAALSVVSVVFAPLVLLDALVIILSFIGLGISIIPITINLLFITPLGLMVFIDYLLPLIRGN